MDITAYEEIVGFAERYPDTDPLIIFNMFVRIHSVRDPDDAVNIIRYLEAQKNIRADLKEAAANN